MEPEEVIHSKPDDPYTVMTRWDDEGFHLLVQADIFYNDDMPNDTPDEVRRKIQKIAQDLTEAIFRGQTFKRHVR